jgi:hypothetical protein
VAAALLVLGTGIAGLVEVERRHNIQVADLAGQLAQVERERDEALGKLNAAPPSRDDQPRLALAGGLPPDESPNSLPAEETALAGLPPDESPASLPAEETMFGPERSTFSGGTR